MTSDLVIPAWPAMTSDQARRWEQVLATLAAVLEGHTAVVIDSHQPAAATVLADRLAVTFHQRGQHTIRLTDATPLADEDTWHAERQSTTLALADGPRWRANPAHTWSAVIWLRTPDDGPASAREHGADIVIDLNIGAWPVIRHISTSLAPQHLWYRAESQAFFGVRAATWDARFGDDIPVYAAAIADAGIRPGGSALDLGCGTGRALPALREAVGAEGVVIGIDYTREMLAEAQASGRATTAWLIQADATHLPLRDGCVDAIFAAGLITHLPDIRDGLSELARVTAVGGRLILFHPSGRAALAARHGRALRPDEPLAHGQLAGHLAATSWRLSEYDDAPHRFLAIGVRLA